jgi:hypothetical protein
MNVGTPYNINETPVFTYLDLVAGPTANYSIAWEVVGYNSAVFNVSSLTYYSATVVAQVLKR